MKIGTIGAGFIAQAIAAHALRTGNDVVLSNSQGPETLGPVIDRLNSIPGNTGTASAGSVESAASQPMVLLAVPWTKVRDALAGLPEWKGRILVDATNQYLRIPPNPIIDDLDGLVNSEVVAGLAPGAKVVKAFNSMYGRYVAANPIHPAGRQVLFYAGDDDAAKQVFATLAEGFGFAPVDLGTLHDGGSLMQLGGRLVLLHVLKED